jgi:hypothetical protein
VCHTRKIKIAQSNRKNLSREIRGLLMAYDVSLN